MLDGPRFVRPGQLSAVVSFVEQADRSVRWPAFLACPWPAAQSPLLQTPASDGFEPLPVTSEAVVNG